MKCNLSKKYLFITFSMIFSCLFQVQALDKPDFNMNEVLENINLSIDSTFLLNDLNGNCSFERILFKEGNYYPCHTNHRGEYAVTIRTSWTVGIAYLNK